ncbi:hypothetical protein [Actinomadura welshii]|uniref:hypothetical protein n=1 Tax=Actinomadura welshii TaxID=3103817 RepID=UPI001268D12E|nr:hypothetical protein [Actinomadura madurae]
MNNDVIAAPVTIEPPAEDDQCLVIAPGRTVFGVDVTLWGGLRGPLPIRTLEVPVDAWDHEIADWTDTESTAPPANVPKNTRRGREILSEFEPEAELRAELQDELDLLRAAPALPAETTTDRPFRSLQSMMGKDLNLGALRDALDLPQHEVMKLLSGRRLMTPDMANAITEATDLTDQDVAQAIRPLPSALVAEVDHPRWRRTWRTMAESRQEDETEVRLTASYKAFALAARETGSGEINWRGRLQQVLHGNDLRPDQDS